MRTAAWAATLLISLASAAYVDDRQAGVASPVEFRLKDGRVIVGEIASFSGGVYSIRAGSDVVRVPERDIRTIALAAAAPVVDEPATPTPEACVEPTDRSQEAASALAEGQAALSAGQNDVARPLLERAKQLDPWSLSARLALAKACESGGDADAAERELRQILAVDPVNARAFSALKELYDRTGQRSKGDLLVVEMLRARYPEPEAEYRSARHFIATGDLDRACAHWNRYLTLRPSPPPAWDVEARMIAEAEAFAAAGQGARAIERCYDLMQHNPLERETALSRVLAVQDAAVGALLASGEVVRACEALDAMAALAPSRASAYRERSAAACSQELSRLLTAGDSGRLTSFLDWLAQRSVAADASEIIASAIETAPPETPASALVAVHAFLANRTSPAWASTRERLVRALAARVEGASADAVAASEALESLDPGRAAEWRARRAEIARTLGLAALSEGRPEIALAHLRTAVSLLPGDTEIASAIETAQLEHVRQRLAAPGDDDGREALLRAFVEGTTNEAHAAWGRSELEKLRSVSRIKTAPTARLREKYFPIAPRTRWVYEWSDGRRDVMRVENVEQEGNRSRIEIVVDSGTGAEGGYRPTTLYATPHEIWQEKEGKRDVWFRLPVVSGQSWESSSGRLKLRRTYLSTNETVDTPMGTFRNCLKVLYESADATGETMASEMFYAPDVGLVRMTTAGGTTMGIAEFQPGGNEGE